MWRSLNAWFKKAFTYVVNAAITHVLILAKVSPAIITLVGVAL